MTLLLSDGKKVVDKLVYSMNTPGTYYLGAYVEIPRANYSQIPYYDLVKLLGKQSIDTDTEQLKGINVRTPVGTFRFDESDDPFRLPKSFSHRDRYLHGVQLERQLD